MVASANRGVRGIFSDDPEEEEDVRSRDKASGRFFSLNVDMLVWKQIYELKEKEYKA